MINCILLFPQFLEFSHFHIIFDISTVDTILHDVAGGECDQLGGENPPQRAGWDGDAPHRQVPTSHRWRKGGSAIL